MVGAGNDFLIIDPPKGVNLKKLATSACNRTNGIGADGLLILEKSKVADYRMRIINADGSEAEMCGNGARCMTVFITKNKKPKKKLFSIDTLAGVIMGEAKGEEAIVRLSDPIDFKANKNIQVNGRSLNVSYIDTGVPHAVVYVDNLKNIDVEKIGNIIRHHNAFKPRGANVNFVEQLKNNLVECRTYERGVESETKACGTGSVAVGIVTFLKMNPDLMEKKNAKMKVKTKSGEVLEITFDLTHGIINNVWLKGSAKFIAKGEYYV